MKAFKNKRRTARYIVCLLLIVLLAMTTPPVALAASNTQNVRLTSSDEVSLAPFSVENMFPGDSVTKDFTITVAHQDDVTIYYHADIRLGFEILAEVLKTKIVLPDKDTTLYDGLMRDMPSALQYNLPVGENSLRYTITVYLDTGVGNITELDTDGKRYMYQRLVADFSWWYLSEDEPGPGEPFPVKVKLIAEKLLDGRYARGSAYTFLLMDDEKKAVQSVKNTDGLVSFESLSFDGAGTYIYYLTEQKGSDARVTYDPVIYKITIDVDENGGANVSYERDGRPYSALPRFVNTTTGEPVDPNKPDYPDNPHTGDDANIGLYAALAVSSLAVLIVLFAVRRKKENKENG